MHEMSLACNIVRIAAERARAAGARRVNRVEVAVGALAGVETEALRFCFAAARRDDPITADADLVLEEIPARGRCAGCGEVAVEMLVGCCPRCGRPGLEIVTGRELAVRALNVD